MLASFFIAIFVIITIATNFISAGIVFIVTILTTYFIVKAVELINSGE